ncbi:ATP-dependent DNA helicase, partial [Parabacteroides distasonis]|nr:ATP-dependent DNA helicase [Parabacteroides distasonis]
RFLKDIDPKYIYTLADAVTTDGLLATRRSSVFQQPKAMEGDAYVSPVAQAVGRQARLTRMETASLSPAPSSSSAPALSGLHVGAKVRHDRFGEGEVTAIEGEGGNAKATVSVAHFGQKQLLLKFARLTIVE